MPNWCDNAVTLTGPRAVIAQTIAWLHSSDEETDYFSFARIVPDWPGDPKTSDGWYNYRLAHWGTKWPARVDRAPEVTVTGDQATAVYRFDTAWSPPIPVIETLAEQVPELTVRIDYEESGIDFAGHAEWDNGDLISQDEGPAPTRCMDCGSVLADEELEASRDEDGDLYCTDCSDADGDAQ